MKVLGCDKHRIKIKERSCFKTIQEQISRCFNLLIQRARRWFNGKMNE